MSYLREIHPACKAAGNENEELVCMCGLVYNVWDKDIQKHWQTVAFDEEREEICFKEGTIVSSSSRQQFSISIKPLVYK